MSSVSVLDRTSSACVFVEESRVIPDAFGIGKALHEGICVPTWAAIRADEIDHLSHAVRRSRN